MNEISRSSEGALGDNKNKLAGNEISRGFTPMSQDIGDNLAFKEPLYDPNFSSDMPFQRSLIKKPNKLQLIHSSREFKNKELTSPPK